MNVRPVTYRRKVSRDTLLSRPDVDRDLRRIRRVLVDRWRRRNPGTPPPATFSVELVGDPTGDTLTFLAILDPRRSE